MTTITYETVYDPPSETLETLGAGLQAFNREVMGDYPSARFAVLVRNEAGEVVGGISGNLRWDWLHIGALWVREDHRGQDIGSRLVRLAEEEALAKGITHSHLETISFQALGFYLKCGYLVFAELKDKPIGHSWYYLKKELRARQP